MILSRFSGRFRRPFNLNSDRKTIGIDKQSQRTKVYYTLVYAVVAFLVGVYLHRLLNIGGFLTTVACIGCTVWFMFTPPYEERKRYYLLMGSALLEGASLGPSIGLAIQNEPKVLVGAFVGSAVVFCCLSGAAMLDRDGEWFFLGYPLFLGLSMLLCLQFATSIFDGSTALTKFKLYLGLFIFVGYTVVDTQKLIECAVTRDLDFAKHARILFNDFIGLFIRILIIMLRNSMEKNKKKMRMD